MKLNIVPASTGWQWVKSGMRTFFKQPLALGGLFFMFMGAVSLMAVIPVVGNLIALALLPAATLGLMAAARQAADGVFPMPRVLGTAFAAGKQRKTAMLKLGGLYAGSFIVLLATTALFDGGLFAGVYLGQTELTQEMAESPAFQSALWVAMALYLPVAAAFWHAPALVHWHGVAPIKSLFFSSVACLRNFGALTVYGLSWLVVYVGVISLFGLVGGLIGGAGMAQAMAVPTTVMVAAMMSTSLYFTFRDSFTADPEPSPQPTGELT